ncbi:MAG: biopolymer transporter ExbD [Gammaproteobacteria bacterium]|jgi:biopolymer transport protein ExbD|nr:biopolymer transporter ExbD [Gammaproteobacteria bacterium]MBT3858779.1 biopolymer transporter ExbD [Gammaproteobacteria bacterium]MBT3986131.1 biopolymer transporter ExbD [Gammaproteobacteria bacterium]MBT4256451.1 biopolymer transporter ExbD [Gammaproteobacteria bacterium]MBT4581008.1 biopolymer transporter ExbD [Gammaproteobacteria bacterium]
MKFKRSHREELQINITPLIDVVFLLLIFFMVTTTFSKETRLLVNLPEANAEAAEAEVSQIEIVVSREGTYSINGRALVNSRLETLVQGLEIESGGDHTLPILLIADAEATHQSVVTAMDGIGQSGFTRLNIATQRPQELEAGASDPTSPL